MKKKNNQVMKDIQAVMSRDFAEKSRVFLDQCAIAAMQGIVSSIKTEKGYQRLRDLAKPENVSTWIACEAYKQAHAMLRERGSIYE